MTSAPGDLVLSAGDVRLAIAPGEGGRIRSFTIAGEELLVTASPDGPIGWGCFPMAPWAGRIRHGRFTFRGRSVELPLTMPPHAIHGIVLDRPWEVADACTLAVELGQPWPFRGSVVERFALTESSFEVALELTAVDAMPAVIGWHPWFRRSVGGADVALDVRPAWLLERDADGLPTGELVPPRPGPWDDAFTGLTAPPRLTWPGRLTLELASSCGWWVVFTERPHGVCVEPQSAPPDAVNLAGRAPRAVELGPDVLEAGEVLRHTMTWRWTRAE